MRVKYLFSTLSRARHWSEYIALSALFRPHYHEAGTKIVYILRQREVSHLITLFPGLEPELIGPSFLCPSCHCTVLCPNALRYLGKHWISSPSPTERPGGPWHLALTWVKANIWWAKYFSNDCLFLFMCWALEFLTHKHCILRRCLPKHPQEETKNNGNLMQFKIIPTLLLFFIYELI